MECRQIGGIKKGAAYTLGEPLQPDLLSGVWNTVLLNNEWRLLDISWASRAVKAKKRADWAAKGNHDESSSEEEDTDDDNDEQSDTTKEQDKKKDLDYNMNEFYFLTDPDQFIYTHFPDDPDWQLLNTPLNQEQFKEKAYLKSYLFDLGMSLADETLDTVFLQTVNGEANLHFSIDPEASTGIKLKYFMYKKRKQEAKGKPTTSLNHYVIYQKSQDEVTLRIFPPGVGKFKLDLYGSKKHSDTLDLLCAYIIECATPNKDFEALSLEPEIGWGFGVEAKDAGLHPMSHTDAVIETIYGEVDMQFLTSTCLALQSELYHKDSIVMRHTLIKIEDDTATVSVRIPREGAYALQLYDKQLSDNGALTNLCNYLIWCTNKDVSTVPFPKLHNNTAGPNPKAKDLYVMPISHKGPTIHIDKGTVDVIFSYRHTSGLEMWADLYSTTTDQTSSMCADINTETKIAIFRIVLQHAGEFGFDVFVKVKEKLHHVHSYLVTSTINEKQESHTNTAQIVEEYTQEPEPDYPQEPETHIKKDENIKKLAVPTITTTEETYVQVNGKPEDSVDEERRQDIASTHTFLTGDDEASTAEYDDVFSSEPDETDTDTSDEGTDSSVASTFTSDEVTSSTGSGLPSDLESGNSISKVRMKEPQPEVDTLLPCQVIETTPKMAWISPPISRLRARNIGRNAALRAPVSRK